MVAARRSKIAKPLTIVVTVAMLVATVAITYFFYQNARYKIEESAIDKISTIATMIDPKTIQALHGDRSDLQNKTYIKTKALLGDVVDINQKFIFLYLMGVSENGQTFFYIDSDTSDDQAWPGDVYNDTTSKMWKAIETGNAQFDDLYDGEDTDRWGTWISAYAPIKDENGRFVALLGVDIDQNKYVTDIVIQTSPPILVFLVFASILFFYRLHTKKAMQQVEREKELLSVASHEVRSPMIGIKWVLDDLLTRPDSLSKDVKATIEAVDKNAAKVVESINGILSSTPSWGGGHRANDEVKMRRLFLDIIDTLALVAKEHQINVHLDQSLTDDVVVTGDRRNFNHAFYNIINNALKYANRGTKVTISYAHQGKYHQFTISDRGPSVKPEDREKIFQGLYRTSEAVASKQSGTGLGLYFVKKIITDHHGEIYVDPHYEGGTSFIVKLP
jgi:signal transduction histidine kinase